MLKYLKSLFKCSPPSLPIQADLGKIYRLNTENSFKEIYAKVLDIRTSFKAEQRWLQYGFCDAQGNLLGIAFAWTMKEEDFLKIYS